MIAIRRASIQDKCFWFFIACCSGVIALAILSHFAFAFIWDDAYFFVRYADNLISSGKITWNPGGQPTYGLTGLLFLVVVAPIRLWVADSPALTAWLASFVCGFVFFLFLFPLVLRYVGSQFKRVIAVLLLFSLASSVPLLVTHLTNGMDATFAAAYVTVYLILIKRNEQSVSLASSIAVGLLGGIAFWVRPDLVLYTLLIPATILLLDHDQTIRSSALTILVITVALTIGEILFNVWYFNSPLPLPFFAKGPKLYGSYIYTRYGWTSLRELGAYIQSYWLFFFLIGANLFLNFKNWRQNTPSSDKGMFLASIIFTTYYAFFVMQIMGSAGRFYFPTLPAIAFLAAQSAVQLIERAPSALFQMIREASPQTWIAAASLLIAALVPAAFSEIDRLRSGIAGNYIARFNLRDVYQIGPASVGVWWFRLDEFSNLPDDLVIAATEIGYPAAMNPRKVIVDLAGLNTLDFAHPPFSTDLLFDKYRPDLIYMPHRDYREMIAQIRNAAYFVEHYDYFDAEELGAYLDIAIWRDSQYYPRMRQIVAKGKAR